MMKYLIQIQTVQHLRSPLLPCQAPAGWSDLGFTSWMCLADQVTKQEKGLCRNGVALLWVLCSRVPSSPCHMSGQWGWDYVWRENIWQSWLKNAGPVYLCDPSILVLPVALSELHPAGQHRIW